MRKNKKVTQHKRAYHRRKKKILRKHKSESLKSTIITIPIVSVDSKITHPSEINPRRKRRKNGSGKMYFDQSTEDAIIAYNLETDINIRERIFREKIHQPFQKLVENVFNTFKFSYFETGPQDAQKECLTHLVANIHKFDPTRSSRNDPNKKTRAFAYFSIVAKHYLILLNNTNHKKFNQNVEISEERDENTVQLQQEDKYYAQKEMSDFIRLIIEFWEKNVDKIFNKQRDLNIANAVIELIRSSGRLEAFNKKAIYLMIREIADSSTQQITKVINKMKQYQKSLYISYRDFGYIDIDRKIQTSKNKEIDLYSK